MKAVFLDCASLDKNDLDFQALHAVFDELILYPSTDAETLVARVQNADVIISNKVMLDADTLKQCSQLKLILISATGTNNIDLQQAKAQIPCTAIAQGLPLRCVVAQHCQQIRGSKKYQVHWSFAQFFNGGTGQGRRPGGDVPEFSPIDGVAVLVLQIAQKCLRDFSIPGGWTAPKRLQRVIHTVALAIALG